MHGGSMFSLGDHAAGRGHEITVCCGTFRDLRSRSISRLVLLWLALLRCGVPGSWFRNIGSVSFRNGILRILFWLLLLAGFSRRSRTSSLRCISSHRMLLGKSLDLFLRRCPGGIRMYLRIPIRPIGISAAGSKLQCSFFVGGNLFRCRIPEPFRHLLPLLQSRVLDLLRFSAFLGDETIPGHLLCHLFFGLVTFFRHGPSPPLSYLWFLSSFHFRFRASTSAGFVVMSS